MPSPKNAHKIPKEIMQQLPAFEKVHMEFEQRLTNIEQQLQHLPHLEKIASFGKKIDLTRSGDFFMFMHEDDQAYLGTSKELRHLHNSLSLSQIADEAKRVSESPMRRYLHHYDPVAAALRAISLNSEPVNLIYVGVNYGFHLFQLADWIRKTQLNCKTYAFDCGIAGTLTPKNIRLNNFTTQIEFYDFALSSRDSMSVLHQIIGHSEDNKIVNDDTAAELRLSCVVETRSLDSFTSEKCISGNTVIVLDTQGNEPEITSGAQNFMKDNSCVLFSEFIPWAIGARMLAQDYIRWLLKLGEVYDLHPIHGGYSYDKPRTSPLGLLGERVTEESADKFAEKIHRDPPNWTDVVVIPRDGPASFALQAMT